MTELTEQQQHARRRLLFGYSDGAFLTTDLFKIYLADVVVLIEVPSELADEAVAAYNTRQPKPVRKEVRNPYKTNPPRTGYNLIIGAVSKPATIGHKSGKGQAGRPIGAKNKAGHKAGGDRKSQAFKAKQIVQVAGQQVLETFGSNGGTQDENAGAGGGYGDGNENEDEGADGEDPRGDDDAEGGGNPDDEGNNNDDLNGTVENSDDDASGSEDISVEPEESSESERKRKSDKIRVRKRAVKGLESYAKSFCNGTIDTDIDNEPGNNVEDDKNTSIGGTNGMSRRSYKPAEGSPVMEYLDGIKEKVKDNDPSLKLMEGAAWIPPPLNPISQNLGPDATPNKSYLANVWVFIFHPMKQYQHLMPAKFVCIFCKSNNTTTDRWAWKPFHWWDNIVYVLHQRVECLECAKPSTKTFATVHPKALATLPTMVAEQFPFMTPHIHGPGYYAPMMLMLVAMMPSSILFGTYAKVINILQRFKFAQTHASYLDAVDHWKNVQPPAIVNCTVPKPFSSFEDQTGYCGIKFLPSLLVDGLRMFMDVHEKYIQAAFQVGVDEGCSSDDSHKLTGHIYAIVAGKKVRPFTATYSVLGLCGKPNISRFKYTKSSDELNEILPAWAKVRANAGQHELLRLEGDNAAGDSVQQHSASPSLSKGVIPYNEHADLPRYEISSDDYKYITTREGLERVALSCLSYIENTEADIGTVRLGLDTEFDINGLHVIALDFAGDSGPTILIHPYEWGNEFEPNMKTILELPSIVAVGVNVAIDIHLLRERFGIKIKRCRDIRRY